MAKLIVLFAFLALASGKVRRETSNAIDEIQKQAPDSIQPIAEELRKANPEGEEQANGAIKKLQAAITNTIAETQKLAKEVSVNAEQINEKLAPKINQAYEEFSKQAEEMQKTLNEAATKQ